MKTRRKPRTCVLQQKEGRKPFTELKSTENIRNSSTRKRKSVQSNVRTKARINSQSNATPVTKKVEYDDSSDDFDLGKDKKNVDSDSDSDFEVCATEKHESSDNENSSGEEGENPSTPRKGNHDNYEVVSDKFNPCVKIVKVFNLRSSSKKTAKKSAVPVLPNSNVVTNHRKRSSNKKLTFVKDSPDEEEEDEIEEWSEKEDEEEGSAHSRERMESDEEDKNECDAKDIEPSTATCEEIIEAVEVEKRAENVIRARVLASNEGGGGQSIYGFVTPKRKDALAKIAQDTIESSKRSSKKSSRKSVKSESKSKRKGSTKNDGSGGKKQQDSDLRRKMRNAVTLAHTLAVDESDESEDDEEESDEEGSSSDGSSHSSDAKKPNEDHDILYEYFEAQSKTKSLTSDKTLAKLKNPKMDQKELHDHLKDIQISHVEETLKLHQLHHQHFKKWMYQLLSGFNVLLYGLGSKHMLLEKFRKEFLLDKVHIVVNGFFPSLQLKQILKMITDDILNGETTFRTTIAHYKYIKEEYDSDAAGKLFIIIHNIDGPMLRSQSVQAALGHLASSRNIHIIASIDHINAPLIWDQNRASAFNWLWYDVTTFEPYTEETSYENSLMVQQTGTLALSSLKHVLHSLTSNAKGIFRVVADYHLDNEDNSSYQGISFNDLYQRCRERFFVNSDLALRAQLTEFKDHKLIKAKKGYDGIEYLAVALDCSTLKMFLEEEEENR